MLELVHVTKRFNLTGAKEDERVALDDISLSIAPGEFVTIIGGNGSGKSTTLNIVSGTLKPDEGKVTLNGVDITSRSEYNRAAYFGRVFQDPMMGTAADMSVLENLEIAYVRGKIHSPLKWGFRPKDKEYFISELKRFGLGLEDRLDQKVGVMSGGQRQALTLLMATMRNHPTYRMMKRDYALFGDKPASEAKKEFDDVFSKEREALKNAVNLIKKDASLSKEEKKKAIRQEEKKFDRSIRDKFDLTKQILLLDEHTAALDPKTAKKVLDLTDRIVRENHMTTLMVTHNMKDALTYGDRLIMFHLGHIILDVKGEEKNKLEVADLLRMFDEADKKAEEA